MIKTMWRPEFAGLYKGVDAEKVAEEITGNGETVTAAQIVAKARDEDTELHKCFEWDDAKAAMGYRLVQARNLTHHLIIREEEPPTPEKPPVRFLVHVGPQEGYKPIDVVFRQEDEYERLLQQAYAELEAFKRKYSRLTELKEILELIA